MFHEVKIKVIGRPEFSRLQSAHGNEDLQASVVQTLDSANHPINHYSVDNDLYLSNG